MNLRRRYGVTFEKNDFRTLICVVTGEWADGTKVWTECNPDRNLIHPEIQYILRTRDNWTEFVRVTQP